METKNGIFYETPATEVLELKTQGIICVSDIVTTQLNGTFVEEYV